LEALVPSQENVPIPTVEVIILDGAVNVNMLRPGSAKTFSDYATNIFQPYSATFSRVYVIWDEYFSDSLKAETRSKRGKGV
jgi:hypothetical protein